ncbi:bifunctional 4-hydroxy-2-oxoglutarate aldolase/2-dehydro-3-deoxy-phosphogluconate aldolase [Ilyomonas limi]|uniref:Bifunctional 4-hydroxy-2-oxoglutarate aldolase/2-dehydro-3-deoxy-phosphogluconate aldolase n=1 Tax=Ilyomonas limi TaxID=2575867 RepID=A0A4U3LCH9_9BACT|nr:bifunctional 4-hydroxy-2-oxoglutarate aldolase/2-dehydro-3-deoxy-phosphogluconate aldolase [Ilyomonas limi]TKK71587.1 bifunctional 4-hydroxy-2-oxoglutarate aldolase/2-dehydro-3-deoxy-phosphogluconate aldolase [Ilyomonas limi]
MSTLSYILQHKIVAIMRGMPPKDSISLANALYKGGINMLEITLNSPDALSVIEELSQQFKDKMLIGAGTVLTAQEATDAINAGAQFIISPALDIDVIKTTKNAGKVSIPGAYTPTEIVQAQRSGADIIKVFPAPNAAYIKNVLAPLNQFKLMPTGGIKVDNIKDFAAAGAVAFGIGSALVNSKEEVNELYLQNLEDKARRFTGAIHATEVQP